jgi:nicotinamide-nucleotide amidase
VSDLETLSQIYRDHNFTLTTAESCTGGGLGSALTSVSGSSDYYLGGFVTYANMAKEKLLGVETQILVNFGAVSPECAVQMAEKCRSILGSTVAVSITGIAGPEGGTKTKPVGLVYIGISGANGTVVSKNNFAGDRSQVRRSTIDAAISQLIRYTSALKREK